MQYINSKDLDYINSFFHFSRIDNRDSIEHNGLQAVAGGENEAINDRANKTIYFSKGISGVLRAIDVWARWEYDRYVNKSDRNINYGYQGYDKSVMKEVIFDKLYNDFKNRQYYIVNLNEGKDGDFEYGDIDIKKVLSRNKAGMPYRGAVWKYGEFSDWGTLDHPNNAQESWNMNTKIGERIIPSDRLKLIETESGRTDALSFVLESYSKFRTLVPEQDSSMYEILDNFMSYAKERYKSDKDYEEGMPDLGRRKVNKQEKEKYQRINKIEIKRSEMQGVAELKDIQLMNETENTKEDKSTSDSPNSKDNSDVSNISSNNEIEENQLEFNQPEEQRIRVYKKTNKFKQLLKKAIEKVKKIVRIGREEDFEEVSIENLNQEEYNVDNSHIEARLGDSLRDHVYSQEEILKNNNNSENLEQQMARNERNLEQK